MNAAAISEFQKNWQAAINVYKRLGDKLPVLREALARNIATALEQLQKR
jgi:hypothetical protein